MNYKLPLVFAPQPEGGFTVTCPLLPELLTEGDSVADAVGNALDAFAAVLEIYREAGRPLPGGVGPPSREGGPGFRPVIASLEPGRVEVVAEQD